MTIDRSKIRAKAMGVVYRGAKILASPVIESDGAIKGYRLPGGSIEFQETSTAALTREFMEEFAAPLKDVRLLTVLENIFSYRGTPGHELVFVYTAAFADESLYEKDEFVMLDATGDDQPYIWVDPAALPAGTDIFPTGTLAAL